MPTEPQSAPVLPCRGYRLSSARRRQTLVISGVPITHVQAYMWLNLAAAGGIDDAAKGRDVVAEKMTPAQIAEAQRQAREWKPASTAR